MRIISRFLLPFIVVGSAYAQMSFPPASGGGGGSLTSGVFTVNGYSGPTVVLGYSDVGADQVGAAAAVQANLTLVSATATAGSNLAASAFTHGTNGEARALSAGINATNAQAMATAAQSTANAGNTTGALALATANAAKDTNALQAATLAGLQTSLTYVSNTAVSAYTHGTNGETLATAAQLAATAASNAAATATANANIAIANTKLAVTNVSLSWASTVGMTGVSNVAVHNFYIGTAGGDTTYSLNNLAVGVLYTIYMPAGAAQRNVNMTFSPAGTLYFFGGANTSAFVVPVGQKSAVTVQLSPDGSYSISKSTGVTGT